MIYVVRHAKAGSRRDWTLDDHLRPLSKKGWAQAEAIALRLGRHDITSLVSSPYVRCVQTLEPLAEQRGLQVVVDPRLEEGVGFEGALQLIAEAPDGAVLCSHGDVIPETMVALERRGCEFVNDPDWRKGTVWLLERDTDHSVTRAKVWGPPGE
jgi:8-oxo-dGTP diphosphatase